MEIHTKIPAETAVSTGSESQPFDYSSENRFNSAISSAQRNSSAVSRISGIFRKGGIHIFHFAYKTNAPEDRLLKIGDFVLSLSMPYSAGVFFLAMKLKPPKIIRHLFPSLIWEIDDPEGVFLTFDDGPSKTTPDVLSALNRAGVKATFFVVATGNNDKYLPLISEAAAAGHQIALHSASHEYSDIYQSSDAYWKDIDLLKERLAPYVRADGLRYLRFPGGSTNTVSRRYGGRGLMQQLKEEVTAKGYAYVDWNVCAEDAVGGKPSAGTIFRNIVRETGEQTQCIVLMHDSATTRTTAEALPDIIQWYKDNGFAFLTVEQAVPLPTT